jgi:hypothetical protein
MRRRAVCHRDAFRGTGGAGGEDDPRVVLGSRRSTRSLQCGEPGSHPQAEAAAEDRADARLAEDELRPLFRLVEIGGHVGRAGGEHGQDADVELGPAGRHGDADPVAGADAVRPELAGAAFDAVGQCAVGQPGDAVVEGRRPGMMGHGLRENIDERARWRRCRGDGQSCGTDRTGFDGNQMAHVGNSLTGSKDR